MAPELQAEGADPRPSCPNCKSHRTKFKYFNNKTGHRENKQPRYECSDCQIRFTLGDFGRIKPMHYAKKRNQDPPEFHGKATACPHCHEVDRARFKYYNNKAKCGFTQPRFLCLNERCNKQFQMFFDWAGDRLVPNMKTKWGPHGEPQSPELCTIPTASTSCSYDVVNHAEHGDAPCVTYDRASCEPPAAVGQSSEGGQYTHTQDVLMAGTLYPDPLRGTDVVPMEQVDVDWLPAMQDPMDVARVPCQIPGEDAASAYATGTAANAGELDLHFSSDDQAFFDALLADPMEHGDAGIYSSASEYDEVNAGRERRLAAGADVDGMEQADVDWVSAMMDPMDVAEAPFQVPGEDAASACLQYEVVNAEQVDRSPDTDAVPATVEPGDVGRSECPQAADTAAARAVSVPSCHVGEIPYTRLVAAAIGELAERDAGDGFPAPDGSDMVHREDFGEDDFECPVGSLWDAIVV